MAPQRQAAQLADEFDASYPAPLAQRLEWLAEHLRLERPRLLRLMGLGPNTVKENRDASWETIVKRWQGEAWWMEQLLCQLIALFGYDWRSLASRLHQPVPSAAQLGNGFASRPAEHLKRVRLVPPADREGTLLALIHQGGPDVLLWLIEYLVQPTLDGMTPPDCD
ncbi:MAG: hypothetical protein L0Z62_35275 [Gemmataceae bacterium]|nr:hypothetical protein [Gemmataceae bacterium]